MSTVDQILETIKSHGPELRRLGACRLGLFGSAARGEATAASDLDFIVELQTKTFDSYMDVKEELERLFARKIDLVTTDALKPQLRAGILQEARYAEGL